MLRELRVRQLGLIDDLSLVLGPGMTALTGETGAGKTLLVEALLLLLGGRADPMLVRPGAAEAVVEARFGSEDPGRADDLAGPAEVVMARRIPAAGRSRSYLDGDMAPLSALAEAGAALVDVHGQHAHQTLLSPQAQRDALDAFGAISHAAVERARAELTDIETALAELGGDARARARELDLLRFQVSELDGAGLVDAEEDDRLAAEEERLADAGAHRDAAAEAYQLLAGDPGESARAGSVRELLGRASAVLSGRTAFAVITGRLGGLDGELEDLARELRVAAEGYEDDPARLAEVRHRRVQLRELLRKYGDDLGEVLRFADAARERLAELEAWDERAAALDTRREAARGRLQDALGQLAQARRRAAPGLARAVEASLRQLAMPRARFEVAVADDESGGAVTFLLAANPGEPLHPLAKVASGGELARSMLALRLVLGQAAGDRAAPGGGAGDGQRTVDAGTDGRPAGGGAQGGRGGEPARTLIFDEVDAGIGGEAAVAVGRALAQIAREHQVLVVTHLAQVAAFADHQVAVSKAEIGGRTVAGAEALSERERAVELSRMLSGQPDSATARRHARELLAAARAERAEEAGLAARGEGPEGAEGAEGPEGAGRSEGPEGAGRAATPGRSRSRARA